MTPILQLDDFRKKPKAKMPSEPRWFCVGCDSRVFQILATGDIYCDGCKQPIGTIKAVRV
jgi:hypothetical protein